MPSLYHFNSDQFKENLILGAQQHMVVGRLCQYLKGWQLDGIRFLYKHFEKGESCILNDESGLGKVVTTAIFLGAVLSNDTTKKCLIIVRDDEYIDGWRFHLSVLTQLSVQVIERTSDINQETVFLIKWSTIKDIGQISKTTFDHIIVDNRGDMLTNKFCTGILLRYYENKVSLVISSSDVTSDVNLLHILLRLCGRLDRQYADVKLFEEKFQLPALKEGVSNKIDLEDYFLKREKVINFCREFRLRRYRHQFDEQFPLVPCSDFKRHLEQWRNNSNSQTSGSAKLCSSSSEKDVEELFQEYFRIKKERDDRKKSYQEEKQTGTIECDDDKSNSSDELVVMSPLLFISESESENDETQLIIEPSAQIADEIKEEDENKNEKTEGTSEKETMPSSVNRRKLTKPVKKPTPTAAEALSAKSLRSRKVLGCSKPSVKTRADGTSADSTRKRGRPFKSKPNLNANSEKHTKTESISTKDTRDSGKNPKEKIDPKSVKGEAKKKDSAADSNTTKPMQSKDDDKKKKKSPVKADHISKKDTSEQSKVKSAVERSTQSGTTAKPDKDKEAVVSKLVTEPQNSKASDKKSLKRICPDKEVKQKVEQKKAAKAVRRTRSKLEDEDYDPFESVMVKVKKKKLADDVSPTKQRKDADNQKRLAKNANDKDQKKHDQKASPETTSKNEKDQRRHGNDASVKDKKKPDQETHPETTSKKGSRTMLDLVIEEASKFLKVKSPSAAKSKEGSRRMTRTSEKSPVHDKSTSNSDRGASKSKSPNSSKQAKESNNVSPNRTKPEKDKSDTPKRCKPLTVYTLLGVHSRSTRGMQRYTRSSSVQNKYMKVSEAQVGLDKLSKPRRLLIRRQSMVGGFKTKTKTKPSAKNIKPDTESVPESCGILESMQLGQALTPTNGCTVADLAVPIPKKVGYDFPLMLDKEIPDSECIITSQSSNKTEVIILTGSSTSDNDSEMEPPKTTVNRRTSSMKPPMVTIPRHAQQKAKSPDLFSTCSDLSLPCSQQKTTKSTFEGFKIFGSEVRQHLSSTPLDGVSRITQQRSDCLPRKDDSAPRKDHQPSPTNHPVEDEDAMFEITSNGTFNNIIRVNSNGELSPLRNKNLSTPPSVSHQRNRITNYLIGSNQQLNGTSPSPSLDDQIDNLQKTPKRRKSLSGTMKRSPRGMIGNKMQSIKLREWLMQNNPVVRISDKSLKASSTKRKRLDLLYPDDK